MHICKNGYSRYSKANVAFIENQIGIRKRKAAEHGALLGFKMGKRRWVEFQYEGKYHYARHQEGGSKTENR